MAIRKSALIACIAAVFALALTTSGDAASRTNNLTFSGPISLPGVTLPAGTYTFELIDLHPDIVRVMSPSGSRVYFTGFTMRVARPVLAPRAVVTFTETGRGVAPRIDVWYPLGRTEGRRFIYSDAT